MLFLLSLLPAANAQCISATYTSTCHLCTTKLTTISATTLQNCHVNTSMADILPDPPAGNDIRPLVQQWGDYGRFLAEKYPSKLDQFCWFSALDTEQINNVYRHAWNDTRYPMTGAGRGSWTRDNVKAISRKLGCFLNMTRGEREYHFINGVTGDSWKFGLDHLGYLQMVYRLFSNVNSRDTDFIAVMTEMLKYSKGKNPFSSKVYQFGFYFIIYSLAKKSGADIANLQEHILYTDWSLMEFKRLTNAQRLSYYKYQTGAQTYLPKRGISSVIPLTQLQSTCPLRNTILTVGCMVSIGINCQYDSPKCPSYFRAIDYSKQQDAKKVFASACQDRSLKSAFNVLCENYQRY